MSPADTQPTEQLPEWASAAPEPRRRRRAWPWVVAAVIVAVGLAIAAWFAAEAIARVVVENTIRTAVITKLALPADQPVEVVVAGAVLPQLIAGSLDAVTVSSQDVALGEFAGDVTVHVEGLAIRGEPVADSAAASVRLDQAQLQALLATVDGFPAQAVGLEAPNVTMSTQLSLFGVSIPVGVALTPSAESGDIVLTPATLQLAGAEVSAADLKDRFGRVADTVLRSWTVCVAKYIPSGVVLHDVRVEGDAMIAGFTIDGRIAADPALQADGTCT